MKLASFLKSVAVSISVFCASVGWTQTTLPIRIGAATSADHAPVFAAMEKGFFAKHGLDAKVIMYQSGVDMVNGMLGGAQEVSVMGSIPFMVGAGKGQPLVLIGTNHGDPVRPYYVAAMSVVGRAGAGLKEGDLKSLAGKKIGLVRGAAGEGYMLGLLAGAGLKVTDVTLVNLPPANQVTALRQGDIDAMAAWEPWSTTAAMRVSGAFRLISGKDQPDACKSCFDPGTLLSTRADVANKAEVLKRFIVAYAEAQQWVRQNYDAAAEINMRWIPGVELDVMKVAIRRSAYDMRLSKLTVQGFNQNTMPLLVNDKRLEKAFDAATVVDPQFTKHAEKTAPQFFSDLPRIPANAAF
jgi:NitT/TauT family transport system substrate-binding protein/sulfonate transport system substrate-binding protein